MEGDRNSPGSQRAMPGGPTPPPGFSSVNPANASPSSMGAPHDPSLQPPPHQQMPITDPNGMLSISPSLLTSPPLHSHGLVFPSQRSFLDRILDMMVGEDHLYQNMNQSQQDKYALICEQCFSHNGLVRLEELQTVQYTCPKCGHFNSKLRHETNGKTSKDAERPGLNVDLKSTGLPTSPISASATAHPTADIRTPTHPVASSSFHNPHSSSAARSTSFHAGPDSTSPTPVKGSRAADASEDLGTSVDREQNGKGGVLSLRQRLGRRRKSSKSKRMSITADSQSESPSTPNVDDESTSLVQ